MKFRAVSSHALCSVCLRHKMLIKDFGHHLKARACQKEHYIRHLENQFKDRCVYWRCRATSRLRSCNEICIIMDGMDQGKFSCPRSSLYRSKELNTLQRPRLHITGAICHGYFVAFSVSSPDIPKDSTTMCEMLAHCLTLLQTQGVDLSKASLVVQSDNTPREFKNQHFLRFLAYLTANNIVGRATLRTLRTGHSHEDVDQVFGQLAGHLVHRVRAASTPMDFVQAIENWMQTRLKRTYEKGRHCFMIDQVRDWSLYHLDLSEWGKRTFTQKGYKSLTVASPLKKGCHFFRGAFLVQNKQEGAYPSPGVRKCQAKFKEGYPN